MASLTTDEIRAAYERSADSDFSHLKIDWAIVDCDMRKGSIFAWDASEKFVGQFRTHDKALKHGAVVTKFMHRWFRWA